jgi:hypothetical protein
LRVNHETFREERHKQPDEKTAAYIDQKGAEGEVASPPLSDPERDPVPGDRAEEPAYAYNEDSRHHCPGFCSLNSYQKPAFKSMKMVSLSKSRNIY